MEAEDSLAAWAGKEVEARPPATTGGGGEAGTRVVYINSNSSGQSPGGGRDTSKVTRRERPGRTPRNEGGMGSLAPLLQQLFDVCHAHPDYVRRV